MKAKSIIWVIALCMIASSCKETENNEIPDPGYGFFPLEIGSYVVYKADSIFHDHPVANIPGIHDTAHYYIKEVIESEFLDAENNPSMRIVRYKRNNADEPWDLRNVWFARRSASNAERVEENKRYVKLGFPISKYSNWDGNALNDLDEWRCKYDSLYNQREIGGLAFPQTLRVSQRDYLTEVNDEYAYEIYAKDVGLIFRHHKVLYTRPTYLNNRIAKNIISGYEYKWEIMEYGME